MVPDCFWINYRYRAASADPQAISLSPINQRFRTDQVQFLESAFEVFPRFEALCFWSAFRLGLIRAQKNMPPVFLQSERFGDRF